MFLKIMATYFFACFTGYFDISLFISINSNIKVRNSVRISISAIFISLPGDLPAVAGCSVKQIY